MSGTHPICGVGLYAFLDSRYVVLPKFRVEVLLCPQSNWPDILFRCPRATLTKIFQQKRKFHYYLVYCSRYYYCVKVTVERYIRLLLSVIFVGSYYSYIVRSRTVQIIQ